MLHVKDVDSRKYYYIQDIPRTRCISHVIVTKIAKYAEVNQVDLSGTLKYHCLLRAIKVPLLKHEHYVEIRTTNYYAKTLSYPLFNISAYHSYKDSIV